MKNIFKIILSLLYALMAIIIDYDHSIWSGVLAFMLCYICLSVINVKNN